MQDSRILSCITMQLVPIGPDESFRDVLCVLEGKAGELSPQVLDRRNQSVTLTEVSKAPSLNTRSFPTLQWNLKGGPTKRIPNRGHTEKAIAILLGNVQWGRNGSVDIPNLICNSQDIYNGRIGELERENPQNGYEKCSAVGHLVPFGWCMLLVYTLSKINTRNPGVT